MGGGLELLHAGALVLHLLRLGPLPVDRLVDGHVVLTLEVVGCLLELEKQSGKKTGKLESLTVGRTILFQKKAVMPLYIILRITGQIFCGTHTNAL